MADRPEQAGGQTVQVDRLPEPTGSGPRIRPRTALLVGIPLLVVVLLAGVIFVVTRPNPAPIAERPAGPVANWASGASGEGVVDDEFGDWRGRPLEIAATWADEVPELQIDLPQLRPDGEFDDWERPLDLAIGAIGDDETWEEAADGAYDRRWRNSLTTLKRLWGDRDSTLYIRFAHEMNGNWYPWTVDAGNVEDFVTAWQRFRGLQQDIFPESQLVFCVNRESVESGIDWREMFPGPEYVDVLAVDYYNQYPYVETAEEFAESAVEYDEWGGPKGIRTHLEFAREQGLPLAVPEWSGNAGEGDAPAFVYGMYEVFAEEGGSGPGQILYEILFNVAGYDDNFQMWPETAMPNSAEQYRSLWGD